MTGLQDELRNEQPRRKRNRLNEVLAELDAEDQAALRAALDDPMVPGVAIVRVLRQRGFTVSESIISNYRRGVYGAV